MEKPVSVFAAYRMVCESENKVPPVRKQIEKSRKFDMDGVKTNKNIEGYGGAATDLFSNMNYSGNPNRKYSDKKLTSPFCDDTSACNANSGVFSKTSRRWRRRFRRASGRTTWFRASLFRLDSWR